MEKVTTKCCRTCKIEKSIDNFSKDSRSSDLLQSQCNECNKIYRDKNKRKAAKYSLEYRKNNKDKISEQKKIYSYLNKENISKKRREWIIKNKNKVDEKTRLYVANNKTAINEYQKNYYKSNKEKIITNVKEYRQTLTGKISKKNSNHKRRTMTNQGDATTEQLVKLQQKTKHCYWCNNKLINNNIHIDHYTPLSKGGHHTITNIVISCSSCNLKKNSKDPIQFANSIGKLL